MDPEYDKEQAMHFLQAAIAARPIQSDEAIKTLYTMKVDDYKIIRIHQPLSWRVIKGENKDNFEEEVFHIYGILCGSDLPPVKSNNIAYLKKKAVYIRQSVRLTGLGNPMFAKAMDNIAEIHKVMATNIGNTTLIPWQGTTYEGCDAIDANARYFSLRKNVPHEQGQAFGKGVDPNGVLARIRDQHMIHGYDNKVDYLKEEKDNEGNTKTVRTEPSNFNIGDIVCATITFVSFPTKDEGASMTIILRALTLVQSITTKSSATIDIPKASHIKRKIIFDDDHYIRKELSNMNISDDMNTGDK